MNQTPNGPRLDGWKDISAFLGKSIRTVQIWEEQSGLPIHREMKRVWAIPEELLEWRSNHVELAIKPDSPPSEPLPPQTDPTPSRFPRRIAFSVLAGCIVATAWVAIARNRPGPAVDYQTQGAILSAFDASRRTVWTHAFPAPLNNEHRTGSEVQLSLRGKFVDLDSDGDREFLYRYWPHDLSKENSALLCFGTGGAIRWSFQPGRPLLQLADGRTISGTYTVSHIALLAHPRPDGGRIVVASNHSWDWPQQVAILTAEGKLVAEYWHPGWFFSLDVADLDGDGQDEILLGGVNNAYHNAQNRAATLVVLDANKVGGQGPFAPLPRLQIADLPASTEKRVLLFSEFATHPNPNHYGHVERISVAADRSVQLVLSQGFGAAIFDEPYAHIQLDSQLKVTRILPGAKLKSMLAQRNAKSLTPDQESNLYRKSIADVLVLP